MFVRNLSLAFSVVALLTWALSCSSNNSVPNNSPFQASLLGTFNSTTDTLGDSDAENDDSFDDDHSDSGFFNDSSDFDDNDSGDIDDDHDSDSSNWDSGSVGDSGDGDWTENDTSGH